MRAELTIFLPFYPHCHFSQLIFLSKFGLVKDVSYLASGKGQWLFRLTHFFYMVVWWGLLTYASNVQWKREAYSYAVQSLGGSRRCFTLRMDPWSVPVSSSGRSFVLGTVQWALSINPDFIFFCGLQKVRYLGNREITSLLEVIDYNVFLVWYLIFISLTGFRFTQEADNVYV